MANVRDMFGKVDRRGFLAASATGVVVAAIGASSISRAAVSRATWGARQHTKGSALGRPARRRSALTVGMRLGSGWTVKAISPVEAGAIRLTVVHAPSGRAANVSICRGEFGSHALASTGTIDLFLMNNGGNGQRRTPDDEVRMVHRLAARLRGDETALPGAAHLLGRNERLHTYDPIDHANPFAF